MTEPANVLTDPCFDPTTGKLLIEPDGFWSSIWAVFFAMSFAFWAPGLLVCAVAPRLSKDPAFCRLLAITTACSMWMLWACVYLSQVSPLIRPSVRPGEPECFLGNATCAPPGQH